RWGNSPPCPKRRVPWRGLRCNTDQCPLYSTLLPHRRQTILQQRAGPWLPPPPLASTLVCCTSCWQLAQMRAPCQHLLPFTRCQQFFFAISVVKNWMKILALVSSLDKVLNTT